MKEADSFSPREPTEPAGEALSSLELKEAINSLFMERAADIAEVLGFITHALAVEPVPKAGDTEAEKEYNAKMEQLARLARHYQGRARELETLADEIRSRTSSDSPPLGV